MLTRIGAFALKAETTVGTAEAITATECILAREPNITPEADVEEREVVRDQPEKLSPKVGGSSCSVEGTIELKGSGTAGTAVSVQGDALQAMGLSQNADSGYAVRYTLDKDLSGIGAATAKIFRDGKYITAHGCRLNGTITAAARKMLTLALEGQGVLEDHGDTSVLSTTKGQIPPVLTSAEMFLLEHHASASEDDLDGSGQTVNDTTNDKVAKTVTQGTTAQEVFGMWVAIQKVGTPANETNGVWVEIQGDNTGDPDGTAISNGTSEYLGTAKISETDYEWYFFEFGSVGSRPELTASNDFHFVIKTDYDADGSNCVKIGTDSVVAGDQNSVEYDTGTSSWVAITTENLSMLVAVAPNADNYFMAESTLNLNNEVALQDDPNDSEGYAYALITDRDVQLECSPLEKLNASQNFWNAFKNDTDMCFHLQAGDTDGNIIELNLYHVKLMNVGGPEDSDGQVTRPITARIEDYEDFELIVR